MSNSALEERIRALSTAGELQQAATEAIRGYGPQILGYLRAIVRNEEDAADVFGLFAEDLWRGLPQFRWEGALRVWAYRLAWHAAARFSRDLYRQRGRRLRTSEISLLADSIRSSVTERRSESFERLRKALDQADRTLLILRLDKKLSWREVAQVLAAPSEPSEAALRKRFERIKEKLAKQARAQGLIE